MIYFFDVFLVYFDGSNSGWISHLIPSHLGHVKQLWIPLSDSVFLEANGSASATGGIGRFTDHWKAQHDAISYCVIATRSNWIMEVRIWAAGRKHNGLPELFENHLNSKRVGTTVLSKKKGAKPWDITLLPCIMVPRRGTGISLDTTWARNGCSTRLSNTPSSKRLSDLKSAKIRRLELWTCGKPTGHAIRIVWITRVKIQYDFSIETCTNLLKLMRAEVFHQAAVPRWVLPVTLPVLPTGTPTRHTNGS